MTSVESKKGTTTVSLVAKDAVIIAADKRVSLGYLISNKDIDKIFKISDSIALTIAGTAADGQMLAKFLQAEINLYRLNVGAEPTVETASSLMQNILFSQGKSYIPYLVQLILAGASEDGKFAIYTLDPLGSSIKETKFHATGSGSPMAFGVFEDNFREEMSEDEAIKLATRAISAAIRRDMGSGEGIDIVVIHKKGYKKLDKIPVETVIKTSK